MAGAAGVTLGLLYSSAAPFMRLLFGLKSFVCMLVAGNRYIEAIMAVGLLLGVVEAMVTGYVSPTCGMPWRSPSCWQSCSFDHKDFLARTKCSGKGRC